MSKLDEKYKFASPMQNGSWQSVLDAILCEKKLVNDLHQVDGFLWVSRFPLPIKLNTTI
jgi:hypothetical protein